MKTFKKIKTAIPICILCLLICSAQDSAAQHFGHFGGGGFRGGGGGFRGGGSRSINGGSRNFGNHVFHNGGWGREGFRGFHGNEGIYHHVYGFHPYFYHPFYPYYWGPFWHPYGFFITALTADAILLTIAGEHYYYDNGVYYIPSGSGYTVVAPPVGAVVGYLPSGFVSVPVGDASYYYYGGTFYIGQGSSFRVVPAPVGAIVTELPEGAKEQAINGETYILYNNAYYQPIFQNGHDAYEVVQIN